MISDSKFIFNTNILFYNINSNNFYLQYIMIKYKKLKINSG